MKFSGVVKSIAVKPTKDASQVEVRIVGDAKRGVTEALVRLLMADVTVDITETQLSLPEQEEAGK
jgi:hypothetical protein